MATTSTVTGANPLPADFLASVNRKTETQTTMEAAENRFLKLLTTQLKNQDPLNPLDNAQMTSQMAQISTVNGIEKLNSTLEKLMSNSSESQTMQAAAMLGHDVLVPGNSLELGADGVGQGGFELKEAANSVTVSVRDSNGLLVRTLPLGGREVGQHGFVWDGNNDAGAAAVAGRYSVSVSAERGGKEVAVELLEKATVTGILKDKNGMRVELGQSGNFPVSDIRQIY